MFAIQLTPAPSWSKSSGASSPQGPAPDFLSCLLPQQARDGRPYGRWRGQRLRPAARLIVVGASPIGAQIPDTKLSPQLGIRKNCGLRHLAIVISGHAVLPRLTEKGHCHPAEAVQWTGYGRGPTATRSALVDARAMPGVRGGRDHLGSLASQRKYVFFRF